MNSDNNKEKVEDKCDETSKNNNAGHDKKQKHKNITKDDTTSLKDIQEKHQASISSTENAEVDSPNLMAVMHSYATSRNDTEPSFLELDMEFEEEVEYKIEYLNSEIQPELKRNTTEICNNFSIMNSSNSTPIGAQSVNGGRQTIQLGNKPSVNNEATSSMDCSENVYSGYNSGNSPPASNSIMESLAQQYSSNESNIPTFLNFNFIEDMMTKSSSSSDSDNETNK